MPHAKFAKYAKFFSLRNLAALLNRWATRLNPSALSASLGTRFARLGRAGPCGRFAARPSASANLTTSSQAHLPMGRAHPQGAATRLCVPPTPHFSAATRHAHSCARFLRCRYGGWWSLIPIYRTRYVKSRRTKTRLFKGSSMFSINHFRRLLIAARFGWRSATTTIPAWTGCNRGIV